MMNAWCLGQILVTNMATMPFHITVCTHAWTYTEDQKSEVTVFNSFVNFDNLDYTKYCRNLDHFILSMKSEVMLVNFKK